MQAFSLRHWLAPATAVLLAAATLAVAHAAQLRLSCTGVGQELAFCEQAAQVWAKRTGHTVDIVTAPGDASQRLALYRQLLAAGSDSIDVLQVDVVWPGLLAGQLLDLLPFTNGAEKEHFAGFISNNTVAGRLVAMPWFANAGLLFYRKDLLQRHGQDVPRSWDELERVARLVQQKERAAGNTRMWGFVWQGRAYEGLTCNALEWVASHGGGAIVDPDGRITVRNPAASRALQRAAAWPGTISPAAVLNYAEEESRGVFQSGNAVFMRNWPYAWALAQDPRSAIRDKVGVTTLPRGGGDGATHAATLGGESLAVSRFSRHPAEAADLVLHMTSAIAQKQRALRGAFNPTRMDLYRDPDILAANPFMGELQDTFSNAVARPSTVTGARYNQVSNQFWNTAHDVLSGRSQADAALAQLERRLQRLRRGGKWP